MSAEAAIAALKETGDEYYWGDYAVRTVMERVNKWLTQNECTVISIQEKMECGYTVIVFAEGEPKPAEQDSKTRKIEL